MKNKLVDFVLVMYTIIILIFSLRIELINNVVLYFVSFFEAKDLMVIYNILKGIIVFFTFLALIILFIIFFSKYSNPKDVILRAVLSSFTVGVICQLLISFNNNVKYSDYIIITASILTGVLIMYLIAKKGRKSE